MPSQLPDHRSSGGSSGETDVAARRRRLLVAAVAWALLVAMLLLLPVPGGAGLPWGLDKAVHGFLFFVLAALLSTAGLAAPGGAGSPGRRLGIWAWISWALATAWGALTEAGQWWVARQLGGSRSAEPGDLLADAAGAAMAVLVFQLGVLGPRGQGVGR